MMEIKGAVFVEFTAAYAKFMAFHTKHRTGIRRERLAEHGHGERTFLERVWWPMFGHFERLHPEFEVCDYRDANRYIDFAYIQPSYRIAIEIEGYGAHVRNITKWKFADGCNRQNHLVIDGWKVLRFAYTDLEDQPRMCQQTIQHLTG